MKIRFALFACFVGLASGCSPYAGERTYEEGSQLLEGLSFSERQSGKPVWELKSPRGSLLEEQGQAEMAKPELAFYTNGKLASRATAETGSIDTRTRSVILSSHVVLHSIEDDATMTTESLVYASSRNLVYTDLPVDVRRPDGHMRGAGGLEATPDLKEVRIKKTRAVINR